MPPIRVLHVLGRLEGGGIQRAVLDLMRHSSREKYSFDVCEMASKPGPLVREAESLGVRVFQIPFGGNLPDFSRRFGGLLRENQYSVVHVNRSSAFGFIPIHVARQCGVPVRIAQFQNIRRGSILQPRRLVERIVQRLWQADATHIIGITDEVLASHFGEAWRCDSRILEIPNGVDVDFFQSNDRARVREQLGLPPDALVVGNVARFSEAKNHRAILECARLLCPGYPTLYFLLVGDGPLRREMEEAVRSMGFSERIRFVGWRDEVPSVLSAMDVFLFPSLWEGQGIALVEAQAAGLPCVTTPLRCFDEVLPPELKTYCAAADDFAGLARNVELLLADEGLRRSLGECARNHARRFDIRRIVEELDSIYRSAGDHP